MTLTKDALLGEIAGLDPADLERWIAEGLVRPERAAGRYDFGEIDIARIRLIIEIRRDLAVEEESLPLVLSLLDQVYSLRRDLGLLCRALAGQPDAVRRAIADALRET
jgi:chaperone modulatory protein CbpM